MMFEPAGDMARSKQPATADTADITQMLQTRGSVSASIDFGRDHQGQTQPFVLVTAVSPHALLGAVDEIESGDLQSTLHQVRDALDTATGLRWATTRVGVAMSLDNQRGLSVIQGKERLNTLIKELEPYRDEHFEMVQGANSVRLREVSRTLPDVIKDMGLSRMACGPADLPRATTQAISRTTEANSTIPMPQRGGLRLVISNSP